jgi:hypothetical protein
MGGVRNAYSILIGKPERNKPLGRQEQMGDNFYIDLKIQGYEEWIELA